MTNIILKCINWMMKKVLLEIMNVDRESFDAILKEGFSLFSLSSVEFKAVDEFHCHTHRVIVQGDDEDLETAVEWLKLDGFYEVSA